MDSVLISFLSVLGGFLASGGGFWIYLKSRFEKEDCIQALIMGLAHDKIICLGLEYIEKGFVTKDEYDDLFKYFWEPYKSVGGNSSAERIIHMVELLPLKPELRQHPRFREAQDKLLEGTNSIIDRVEEGDDRFERHPRHDPRG